MKITIKNKTLRNVEPCCDGMALDYFHLREIQLRWGFKRNNKFEGQALALLKDKSSLLIDYCPSCGAKVEWIIIDDLQEMEK